MMIYGKYKNRMNNNIFFLLINKINNEDFKNILNENISNQSNKQNFKICKSELIKILEKNDLSSLHAIIKEYKEECFNKFLDLFINKDNKFKLNDTEIEKISLKFSDYLKLLLVIKNKGIDFNQEIELDLVLSIMIIECINYNYKSLICLIIEYFLTKNIFDDEKENNKKMYHFIFNFINYIQNNFTNNEIVIKYKFNQIHKQKYNAISSPYIKNIINFDNFSKITNNMKFNYLYKCNIKEMQLFYLEDEKYPRIDKNHTILSTFSNTRINSKLIILKSGNYGSLGEYLEMAKFIDIKTS